MNYVVTCCDNKYWERWGRNWLSSLRQNYVGEVVLIGYDLPKAIVDVLQFGQERSVKVINRPTVENLRDDALLQVVEMIKEGDVYAYWDIDTCFQADISEIFDLAKDTLVFTKSAGFCAGSFSGWKEWGELYKLITLFDKSPNALPTIKKHFNKLFTDVDETWNFTDVTKLRVTAGKLFFDGQLQKVIHPKGEVKSQMTQGDTVLVLNDLLRRYMLLS